MNHLYPRDAIVHVENGNRSSPLGVYTAGRFEDSLHDGSVRQVFSSTRR